MVTRNSRTSPMDPGNTPVLPLEGIRVVDWTIAQAGPCATMLLADMGAEVIKIEPAAGADSRRGGGDGGGMGLGLPNGLPYTFEVYNRNKKSLAVDLRTEEGRKIVYSLVEVSNVFVHNHRVGVPKQAGLDYAVLQGHNPRLVYANCSGYGRKGPRAHSPANDAAIHAASGMMLGMGAPEMPPIHMIGATADMSTAIMLAYGITTALLCVERTGIGQEIHVSMLATRLWIQSNNILFTLLHGRPRPRQSRTAAPNPLVNQYRCKDDKWILLSHYTPERYWPPFCKAMGLEELEQDPRFQDSRARRESCEALIAILDGVFATRTREEWMQVLEQGGLIVSPILDYLEVVNDPQVAANDLLPEFDHPVLGKLQESCIPVEFDTTPGSIREPAPHLGQHTEEVLVELLGYSRSQVARLQESGVVAQHSREE
jgi:formyl-CoA transferase